MRFTDAPQPDPNPSRAHTRPAASSRDTGCALCHTPRMQTAPVMNSAVLQDRPVNLYSDLLVHHMGAGLADDIIQGAAGPDEFRTTPLWGVGQRMFFLHDGRTGDLLEAINQHFSPAARELPALGGECGGAALPAAVGRRQAGDPRLPAFALNVPSPGGDRDQALAVMPVLVAGIDVFSRLLRASTPKDIAAATAPR